MRETGEALIDPPGALARRERPIKGADTANALPGALPGHASLTIDLDQRELGVLEAYAASRGTSLRALVRDFLRVAAEDVVAISLPVSAGRPFVYMLRHRGADQVAGFLGNKRWDDLERPLPQVLTKCLRETDGLVLDIGASSGFYSLLMAAHAPDASIVAFEPYSVAAGLLVKNVELNRLSDRIAVNRSAVSSASGEALLFVPVAFPGILETSASLEREFKPRHSQAIRIPTTTVDAFVPGSAPSMRLCLIKMDVEGHEGAVLKGASTQIRTHRPLIFTRVLDRIDLGELTAFITEAGYLDLPLIANERPRLQAAVTFEPRGWDHLLVPAERAAEVLRSLEHSM